MTPAHVRAGGDFIRRVPGFVLVERPDQTEAGPSPAELVEGIVGAVKEFKDEKAKRKPKRPPPGPRKHGPGTEKRDPKQRTAAHFDARYDEVSKARDEDAEHRATLTEKREQALADACAACGMTLSEARRRGFEGAEKAVREGRATPEQMKLVYRVESGIEFAKRRADESTRNQRGEFVWPGGEVTAGCYRAPFQKRGFKSSLHHHYRRFAASCGRAFRRNLLAGDKKDGCWRHVRKINALDRIYVFFSAVCHDIWRVDIDRDFESYEAFRAWIEHVVEEHDLPCRPHIVDWIPDERRPGRVIRPHLYFILPDGSEVWPHSPPRQHDMLKAVIKATQEAFGGDRGGNAHPFSGKNPLSWLVESRIVEPERMPTLGEWYEGLGSPLTPTGPLPGLLAAAKEAASLGEESGGWFPVVREAGFAMAKTLHLAGKKVTADAIAAEIADQLTDTLRPTGDQIATLAKLIQRVADFTARTFDSSKMDAKGRRRGAAAHLIEPTMTKEQREAVGGAFSGPVRIDKTVEALAEAMRLDMICGRTPTVDLVAAKGIRCRKTVQRHFEAAYAIAKSRIQAEKGNGGRSKELRALFRSGGGSPAFTPGPGQADPCQADRDSGQAAACEAPLTDPPLTDPPEVPAPASTAQTIDYADDDVAEAMRSLAAEAWKRFTETGNWPERSKTNQDTLRRIERAKRRRLRPSEVRAATLARQPGSLLAAFMASGIKTIHRSIKDPVLRSVVA
ncbi:hypothetical protein CO669_29965 [Bradyrhizobium sp. Y36]|nr:hypothetical protein CO669_29965 [Bradyrhizobium sp. Y36]